MKLFQFLLLLILSALISYATTTYVTPPRDETPVAAVESAYDRVMRTGTLRCGYFEEAPFTIVDPNTNAKSGIAVELAQKVADDLGLRLEWTGVINFGTVGDDLKVGRYDAVCASFFNLARAGRVDYTVPYTYVPVYAYTQTGRTDFDYKLDTTEWANVTVAGLDGEGATTVARKKLPQAKFNTLPQNAQIAEMLASVVDKKADIAFVMPTVFKNFDAANPGKLQRVASDKPFYVFNVSFGLKPGEVALKNMLDFNLRNLQTNGFLDSLFQKYDPDGALFRPSDLYKAVK